MSNLVRGHYYHFITKEELQELLNNEVVEETHDMKFALKYRSCYNIPMDHLYALMGKNKYSDARLRAYITWSCTLRVCRVMTSRHGV